MHQIKIGDTVCDTSVQDEKTFAAEMLKQLYISPMMISTWAFFPASVLSQAGHSKQLPAAA